MHVTWFVSEVSLIMSDLQTKQLPCHGSVHSNFILQFNMIFPPF